MGESPEANPVTPRQRTSREYEDPHFHDEDEVVVPPPSEEGRRPAGTSPPARPARKLPPRPRRFHED